MKNRKTKKQTNKQTHIISTPDYYWSCIQVVTFETESRQYTFKTAVQEELETLVKLIEQQKNKSV